MKLSDTLSLASRGLANYITNRPLTVSFEVTYACNARCKHCHLGGPIPNEKRAKPEEYAALCRTIRPVVAQVSGGEPLLRKDLEEIIRALKDPRQAPLIVVTTNAALLSRKRYQSLKEAGVYEFSVSLDYPDERHDEFRQIPGLFQKIHDLVHELKDEKRIGITASCVVQNDNFRDLVKIARLAIDWNIKINFSTYTWLRTQDKGYLIPKENLPELREIADELLAIRKTHKNVFASKYVFDRMIAFYENQGIPGCRAGDRFFIVNPDATLSPCGLISGDYRTQKELQKAFVRTNTCTACNTSIRANCEKPIRYQLIDNLNTVFG